MNRRKLGLREAFYKYVQDDANSAGCCVVYLQLSQLVSVDGMRTAFSLCCQRHPLLRAYFTSDENNDYFEIADNISTLPFETVDEQTSLQLEKLISEKLNQGIPADNKYLWRIFFLIKPGQVGDQLVCAIHHSISDGVMMLSFIQDLLEFCNAISNGNAISVTELPLLPPVEKVLKTKITWPKFLFPHLKETLRMMFYKKHLYPHQENTPLAARENHIILRELESPCLEKLLNAAKTQRVSLTSLLSATLMKAAVNVNYDGKTLPIRLIPFQTPINLRNRCDPRISKEHFGCYITACNLTHRIASDASVWSVAKNYETLLFKHIRKFCSIPSDYNKKILYKIFNSAKKSRFNTKFIHGLQASYDGDLSVLFQSSASLHLKKLRVAVSETWGSKIMTLYAYSYNGNLTLTFAYPYPLLHDQVAEEIVNNFINILREI